MIEHVMAFIVLANAFTIVWVGVCAYVIYLNVRQTRLEKKIEALEETLE